MEPVGQPCLGVAGRQAGASSRAAMVQLSPEHRYGAPTNPAGETQGGREWWHSPRSALALGLDITPPCLCELTKAPTLSAPQAPHVGTETTALM